MTPTPSNRSIDEQQPLAGPATATSTAARAVYDTLGLFLDRITKDPELRPKFFAAQTTLHLVIEAPESDILVDFTQDPPAVTFNSPGAEAELEVRMTAENAHRFWQGDLNTAAALASGELQVNGPLTKMMRLLPVLQPTFDRYKEFLLKRDLPVDFLHSDNDGSPGT